MVILFRFGHLLGYQDSLSFTQFSVYRPANNFVSILIVNIYECLQTTGWPFSAIDLFGDLLYNLFIVIPDNAIRLSCFKELWELAYGINQWHVQSIVRSVLESETIPVNIQQEVAIFIIDDGYNVPYEEIDLRKVPPIIKKAIRQKILPFSSDDQL